MLLSSLLHLRQLLASLPELKSCPKVLHFRRSEARTLHLPSAGVLRVSHTKPFSCSRASSSVHGSSPCAPCPGGFPAPLPILSYYHGSHCNVPSHYQGSTTIFVPPTSTPELRPFLTFLPVPGKQLGSSSLTLRLSSDLSLGRLVFWSPRNSHTRFSS